MEYSSQLLLWIYVVLVVCSCIHVLPLLFWSKRPGHGSLPAGLLGKKPNESVTRLSKTYGPLMTLKLGSVTAIVASSAAMAREILRKHDHLLSSRITVDAVRALRHHEASMVWLQPETIAHIFTAQKLDASRSLRKQKVQELIAVVEEKCGAGEAVDICQNRQMAFSTVLNLISNTVFSVDMVHDPVFRGARRPMLGKFLKLHGIFDGMMIDDRIKSRSQETGSGLDRHEIKALFVDVFVAGTDTTSSTVERPAMAELLRDPRLESHGNRTFGNNKDNKQRPASGRIRHWPAALFASHRGRDPSFASTSSPPRPPPSRIQVSNAEICGFTVPKHTQVIVNAWAIGRDANTWADSDSFRPERFSSGSEIGFKGHDFELTPFGSGRRSCPGLPLAYRMVHPMLPCLLHSFAWELADGIEV
ncbi:hypothetical protein ACLOJK_033170 [Asimina triloba]